MTLQQITAYSASRSFKICFILSKKKKATLKTKNGISAQLTAKLGLSYGFLKLGDRCHFSFVFRSWQ